MIKEQGEFDISKKHYRIGVGSKALEGLLFLGRRFTPGDMMGCTPPMAVELTESIPTYLQDHDKLSLNP